MPNAAPSLILKPALAALACLGLIVLGRAMTSEASESLGATVDPTSASLQFLGAGRGVIQLSLWSRMEAAQRAGRWDEQRTIFELLRQVSPTNIRLPLKQARLEALDVGSELPNREQAWQWWSRALQRWLAAGHDQPERAWMADQELWMGVFLRGIQFPARITGVLARELKDERLAWDADELRTLLDARPEVGALLDKHRKAVGEWTLAVIDRDSDPRFTFGAVEDDLRALNDDDRKLVFQLELVRWRALRDLAMRNIEHPGRGANTELAEYALVAIDCLAPLNENAADQRAWVIERELVRLRKGGFADAADAFAAQMLAKYGSAE